MTEPAPAPLPTVDLVLHGGRITTFAASGQGPAEVSSLAVAAGRVIAIGSDEQLAPLRAQAARVIDLGGRRAIPGLNDSHIHAVRAGASWATSMHWEDVRVSTRRSSARGKMPAAVVRVNWVFVVGGWHRSQLAERRAPTRAELDEAAPDNPVYVQELYDAAC